MKHLSLATLAAAVALGLASTSAWAELVIDEATAPSKPPVHLVKPAPPPALRPAADLPAPRAAPLARSEDPDRSALPPSHDPAVRPVTAAPRPLRWSSVAASASASSNAPSRAGRLVQVGAPAPGPALQGWGDEVPLALALEQILPKGWSLEPAGVDTARAVSWRGGRSWHAILGDLAYGHRFDARIDWVQQRVTLGPAGSLAPSAGPHVATARKEKEAAEPTDEEPLAPVQAVRRDPPPVLRPTAPPPVVVPVVIAPPAPTTWTLDPTKTLRQNVEAWAKKAGWNRVVWEGADYPVWAAASFTGQFDAENGPLAQLMAGYDKSDQPLLARLSRLDKVVSITNRNYMPTTVAPSSPSELSPSAFPVNPEAPIGERR